MKTLLLILITISFISCKDKTPEPQPKTLTQAELIYPVLDVIWLNENLYFIMANGIQHVSTRNDQAEYLFYYYNEPIEFLVAPQGNETVVTYKGVKIVAKRQIGSR